jgi:hypothetical protein
VSPALADTLSVAIGVADGALGEVREGLAPPRGRRAP